LHPEGWQFEGYAFGTRDPKPEYRQRAATPSRNQRHYQTGRMILPEFVIDNDYLQVVCSGVFHPTRCAVVLEVDGRDVRSCSPEPGCGFLGFDASPNSLSTSVKLFQPPVPTEYWFDLRLLQGKRAVIEVRDMHQNGYFSMVKIVATDRQPPTDVEVVTEAVRWLPDHHEASINGDFLLLPVGPLKGTPLQAVGVTIDGEPGEVLKVDLPLAFGSIPVAGYLPIYDLTGHQGRQLKVSFHSFTGHNPSQSSIEPLIQCEIPGRELSDNKPAFHIHNRIGLLNDPNGLFYLDGVYHLFHQFQYNITASSWAHYTSTDLVQWEERPVGLWHDDMGSMHSGSVAVDVLNTSGWKTGDKPPVIAAYTASRGMAGHDKIQMQCIAFSVDGGRTFIKYEGNPIIGQQQLLARGSDTARDPKIFWFSPTKGRDPLARDGFWVLVLFEGGGLTIYTSKNLKQWERHGNISGFNECPELFPLAIDNNPDEVRWIMYGGSGEYLIGYFDGKRFKPETIKMIPMYHEGHCYASQTFNNTLPGAGGQPRRIQIGWQGGRLGQLSTPTELTLRTTPIGLRVCKLPVTEISNLYTKSVELNGIKLSSGDTNPLANIKGGLYDIDLVANIAEAKEFILTIRGTKLVVDVTDKGLAFGEMIIPGTKNLSLRVVVDNTSIDIFFGENGIFYSPRMYRPKSETLSIEVSGGNAIFTKLHAHELKSIWKKK
jgi:sucrose-6-phosphate hydrolase SacC (GH32 family)